MVLLRTVVLASLALTALGAPAHANGRFPNAQILREPAPNELALAGTYGLLLTTNGGADFSFVCESQLFGRIADTTMDPLLELGPGGAILSGSLEGVRISRDHGCTFEPVASLPRDWAFYDMVPPPGAEDGLVLDLARRGPAAGAPVIALVARFDERGAIAEHRVYEAPAGDDFRPIGAPIPLSVLDFGSTLDAAPSDPERIYVSGSVGGEAVVLVSENGAASFESTALAPDDPADVIGAYIAAVSPTDPERLYVRVPRRKPTESGLYTWDDSLLASDDGGASFREALRAQANFLGFALSPDGETVLAGFGDPSASAMLSEPAAVGIYRANALELVFEKIVSDLYVTCLLWTASGLYVCAPERDALESDAAAGNDFHLGVYRGAGVPASAADFVSLLRLRDVGGPLPWFDGRTSGCADEWQSGDPAAPVPAGTCAAFGACGERPPRSTGALTCGAPSGGDGGNSGSWGSGGAGAEPAGAGGNPSAGANGAGRASTGGSAAKRSRETSGCGCVVVGVRQERSRFGGACFVAFAAAVLFGRRARSRRRCGSRHRFFTS